MTGASGTARSGTENALYVIYDLKGAGRVVGIFDTAQLAERVRDIDPHYYRIHRSEVNHIGTDAIAWLNSPEQRGALRALIAEVGDDAG